MFAIAERNRIRDELVATAKADSMIAAAGFVGSSARGREDRWSDIDLALGLAPDANYDTVVETWTKILYHENEAITHLDVWAGATLFRVFLLDGTLQIDIAFWRADDFGAIGPDFELLFGTANEVDQATPPAVSSLVGWAWLYALHARSSIARGRVLQAEYMVGGMRDQVFSLACLRHDVPASQGRGVDDLPADATVPITAAIVRSCDVTELSRAFTAATDALLGEIRHVDVHQAELLEPALRELAASARP